MQVQTTYSYAVPITKSDTTSFTPVGGAAANNIACDAIYVGGAGVVAVVFADGSVVNFTCVAGEILPVMAIRVNSTNTTATLLVALYAL